MKTLHHRFVELIPEKPQAGILYITLEYCTAIHLCVCGCGNEVVTPLSPTDWKISFNGETVSLYPSIGNWNFKCQSHYWITDNKIEMARKWSKKRIDSGRKADGYKKKDYYTKKKDE